MESILHKRCAIKKNMTGRNISPQCANVKRLVALSGAHHASKHQRACTTKKNETRTVPVSNTHTRPGSALKHNLAATTSVMIPSMITAFRTVALMDGLLRSRILLALPLDTRPLLLLWLGARGDEPHPPRPISGPQRELLVRHERRVERRADLGLVHARADEDDLLPAVAVALLLVLLGLGGPLRRRGRVHQPLGAALQGHGDARLAPLHHHPVVARRPQEALGAQHAGEEALPEHGVQAAGVERALRAVDEAGDAILLGLGFVATLQLRHPPRGHAG
mmetsp:Transcript_97432/g.297702  ORF Transcript_97432/g.297702 Transcript_97432/m.297702 type:complete len:278 (-) Transcript_97432:1703-2536(-)